MTGLLARAGQWLANLRRLYRRAGFGGLAELAGARALPRVLSYRRVAVVALPHQLGRPHPELHPRCVRRMEPAVERFYALLAGVAEPRVPAYSRDRLQQRFAAGDELWTFPVGDEIAFSVWVSGTGLTVVGGFTLALSASERALTSGTTAPAHRRRGLAVYATSHVMHVLGEAGVNRVLGSVGGYNERFLRTLSANEGFERLLTAHVLCMAGREWVRPVAHRPEGSRLLGRSGLSSRRWIGLPVAVSPRPA